MTTFGHIETGRTVDVISAPDLATYKRILNAPTVPPLWQIVIVPDGTLNGATPDGQGGYTPPAVIQGPAPQIMSLSGKQFTAYCSAVLEIVNNLAPNQNLGLTRLDQIIAGMKAGALAGKPLLTLAADSWQAALTPNGKFTLADATTFFLALIANGYMTVPEEAGLIAHWPMG